MPSEITSTRTAASQTSALVPQVVNLASELEDALTQLSTREQLLEQVWSQLTGITGAAAAAGAAQGQDDSHGRRTTSILQPKSAIAAALGRTEQLQRLRQQQKHRPSQEHSQQQQHQQPAVAGLARRLSATSDTAAAGLANQAVAAAVRRNSQCNDGRESHTTDATASKAHRLQQHQQQQQQWQQHNQQQELQEVQGLVMDAVQHLRQQVTGLQQELQAAQTGRRDREQELLQRVKQLQQLHQLHAQQQCDLQQVQDQKQRLQAEVVSLGQHLLVREQELRQAQVAMG